MDKYFSIFGEIVLAILLLILFIGTGFYLGRRFNSKNTPLPSPAASPQISPSALNSPSNLSPSSSPEITVNDFPAIKSALSMKLGIDENSPKKIQNRVDGLYGLVMSALVKPMIYLAAGETDPERIAIGTVFTMAVSYLLGPKILRFVDVFDESARGITSDKMYGWLKKKTKATRKALAAGYVAGMISIASLVYTATPDKFFEFNNEKKPLIENATFAY